MAQIEALKRGESRSSPSGRKGSMNASLRRKQGDDVDEDELLDELQELTDQLNEAREKEVGYMCPAVYWHCQHRANEHPSGR